MPRLRRVRCARCARPLQLLRRAAPVDLAPLLAQRFPRRVCGGDASPLYQPQYDSMSNGTKKARQFVDDLRTALIKATSGCTIQQTADGAGWPCGTCVCSLLGTLLPHNASEYSQHNDPLDRVNEVWRAILQMRDFAENGLTASELH